MIHLIRTIFAQLLHIRALFLFMPIYVLVEAFLSPCLGCLKCTTLSYDKHGGFRYQTVVVNPDVEWQDWRLEPPSDHTIDPDQL